MVSTPVIHNYMDYYSFTDPKGAEGWVGLVGWSIADSLSTKWLHVNYISRVDQGKSTFRQSPTFQCAWNNTRTYLLKRFFWYHRINKINSPTAEKSNDIMEGRGRLDVKEMRWTSKLWCVLVSSATEAGTDAIVLQQKNVYEQCVLEHLIPHHSARSAAWAAEADNGTTILLVDGAASSSSTKMLSQRISHLVSSEFIVQLTEHPLGLR